jgi:hypothetical protein
MKLPVYVGQISGFALLKQYHNKNKSTIAVTCLNKGKGLYIELAYNYLQ